MTSVGGKIIGGETVGSDQSRLTSNGESQVETYHSLRRRSKVPSRPISDPRAGLAWKSSSCSIPFLWVATETAATTTLLPRRPLDQQARLYPHTLYSALLLPLSNRAYTPADLMISVNRLAAPLPYPTNLDRDTGEVQAHRATHLASCPAP